MSEEFKILSPRDHVRERLGMYLGSSSVEQIERFLLGEWKSVKYVPALSKMIDEIIDNAIDEAIRTNFKFANKIDVKISDNEITISDNGRGIPQDFVEDTQTNEKVQRPVAAWTRVNAGTSFTDERVSIGANGVGSACTNFVSKKFVGKTWQNDNLIEIYCTDGSKNIKIRERKASGSGTKVSFIPDFDLLDVDNLDEHDTIALIEDRLTSLQMAFPEISFSFNGKRIKTDTLNRYVTMFADKDSSSVISKTNDVSFFFCASEDGFRQNSYVNGVNTRQGGQYVDYIVNGVVDELVSKVKRKYKIDVAKSTIKNGLTFVLFVRNFKNPKFDSQTKERLTSSLGAVKEHFSNSGTKDFEYFAKKIMDSDDIIDPIIEAQLAKKQAADKRAATMAQKKLKKVKVAKHIAATNDDATLALCEGDSAIGYILQVRDPSKIGAFPLRGVVMNTWDMKPNDVLKNKELSELVAILGLDINNPDSVDMMNYKHIATLTDADVDGKKIATLLVGFFYKFWPRLLEEGRVHIIRSPVMISTKGKDEQWFFDIESASKFKNETKGYYHRYLKGLGSLTEDEYDKVINNPYMDTINPDSPEVLEMMFGNDAKKRKEFMTQ